MNTLGLNRKPSFSIGEAARVLGVSTHSLRVYEREGLILCHRTETGRRYYSEIEIEKVRCIMGLIRDEGLNFNAVRKILSLIPCWSICGVNKEDCEGCPALLQNSQPCWNLPEKCNHSGRKCLNCKVYRQSINLNNLKMNLFRSSI